MKNWVRKYKFKRANPDAQRVRDPKHGRWQQAGWQDKMPLITLVKKDEDLDEVPTPEKLPRGRMHMMAAIGEAYIKQLRCTTQQAGPRALEVWLTSTRSWPPRSLNKLH